MDKIQDIFVKRILCKKWKCLSLNDRSLEIAPKFFKNYFKADDFVNTVLTVAVKTFNEIAFHLPN